MASRAVCKRGHVVDDEVVDLRYRLGQHGAETYEHVGYRWVTPEEYWKYDLRVSLANEHVDTLLRYYQQLP